MEISNNAAENAIRPFAVGRKNWLFSDTVKGAESSAIVYTLVETAKANGLEPYAYLCQLMEDLPWYGLNPSKEDLDNALPWSPRMQQLKALADQALRQIAEKKYAEEMRSQGVHAITQYGVAFSGKHVEISVSEE